MAVSVTLTDQLAMGEFSPVQLQQTGNMDADHSRSDTVEEDPRGLGVAVDDHVRTGSDGGFAIQYPWTYLEAFHHLERAFRARWSNVNPSTVQADATLAFTAVDNRITTAAAGGLADFVPLIGHQVLISGSGQAGNNTGFDRVSEIVDADGDSIVLHADHPLVEEAAGQPVTIRGGIGIKVGSRPAEALRAQYQADDADAVLESVTGAISVDTTSGLRLVGPNGTFDAFRRWLGTASGTELPLNIYRRDDDVWSNATPRADNPTRISAVGLNGEFLEITGFPTLSNDAAAETVVSLGGSVATAIDCLCSGMTLEIPQQGFLTMSAAYEIGEILRDASRSRGIGSDLPLMGAGRHAMTSANLTSIIIDGNQFHSADSRRLTTASVQHTNGLNYEHAPSSEFRARATYPDRGHKVSGSLTISHDSRLVMPLEKAQHDKRPIRLSFRAYDPEGYVIVVSVPRVKLKDGTVSGRDNRTFNPSFDASTRDTALESPIGVQYIPTL